MKNYDELNATEKQTVALTLDDFKAYCSEDGTRLAKGEREHKFVEAMATYIIESREVMQ